MTDKNKLELYYREEEVLRDLDDLEKELNEMKEGNYDELSDRYQPIADYYEAEHKFDTILEDNDRLRKELLSTTKELNRLSLQYGKLLTAYHNIKEDKEHEYVEHSLKLHKASLKQLNENYTDLESKYDTLVKDHDKLKAVLRKHVTVLKTVRSDLLKDGDLYAEDEDGHFGVTSSDYRI